MVAGQKASLAERFWSRVRKSDKCWTWTGGLIAEGYGAIWNNGRNVRAHRVSWELHYGAIQEGLIVCHRCDNPPCVRPDHLFLGTFKDNTQDSIAKGRYRSNWPKYRNRGETHPMAKLSVNDVLEIRAKYAGGGFTLKALGEIYGVTLAAIAAIVKRRTWKTI